MNIIWQWLWKSLCFGDENYHYNVYSNDNDLHNVYSNDYDHRNVYGDDDPENSISMSGARLGGIPVIIASVRSSHKMCWSSYYAKLTLACHIKDHHDLVKKFRVTIYFPKSQVKDHETLISDNIPPRTLEFSCWKKFIHIGEVVPQ